MDALIASGIEKAWGGRPILKGIDLVVPHGARIGLVGPNGCGKSTLLQIMAGRVDPDAGKIVRNVVPGVLDQVPDIRETTVLEAAEAALGWHRDLLRRYEIAVEADPREAAGIHDKLDQFGWDLRHRIDATLEAVRAPGRDAKIAVLSGGEKRRVALARALLASPDLLLLDEPTNHLDADTVEWLQEHLTGFRGAIVLTTHDRYLLEAVATKIVEIEDGLPVSYDGSYGDYLIERAERRYRLTRERDTKLQMIAREAAWAARSPAARTVKQKARLDRLDALKDSLPQIREETFGLDLRSGDKLGRVLFEARGLGRRFGDRWVFRDGELDVLRGDRLAIVGPNGAGKTTLLRLVSGVDKPDAGRIERTPKVRIAVLDQDRTGLPAGATVAEAAGGGNDHVMVGDRQVHVAGFLGRFLFSRDQLQQKVEGLSGGERARLLLARMLLEGANVLLLDEPTNDLDLMTLAVLEEALMDFDGAVLVVTHDRAFVDRVCTGVLAVEDGKLTRYASRQQRAEVRRANRQAQKATPAPTPRVEAPKTGRKKLSFAEQRELDGLPAKIEALESEEVRLAAELADPGTYKKRGDAVPALQARLASIPKETMAAYARWEELEARK